MRREERDREVTEKLGEQRGRVVLRGNKVWDTPKE